MSKADGWDKITHYEWHKKSPTYEAQIVRLTGGVVPYHWAIYQIPRSEHIGPDGRYRPAGRGSHQTLAGAKADADTAIASLSVATCPKCGAAMAPGQAIASTMTGGANDFAAETMSIGGPGQMIDCMKCPECGHSEARVAPASTATEGTDE